jgi:AraC-like DNA-binding protein
MRNEITERVDRDAYYEHILIPSDQAFLWRLDDYPWRRNVWNFHPEFELHLIRKSSGLCYIGDHIGPFEQGQLTLVGSNLPHNWITLPADDDIVPERDIVVQFDPDSFLDAGAWLPEISICKSLFDKAQYGVEFSAPIAGEARGIMEAMGHSRGLTRLSMMLELLALLAADTEARTLATVRYVRQSRKRGSAELRRLEVALNHIQQNFLNDLRIGKVAALVGMSESTFSRFFKMQTGNTFTDHVIELRVWMAKKLLKETDNPITEICYEAGFSNISNFNRAFLRKTGLRPREYRAAVRRFTR